MKAGQWLTLGVIVLAIAVVAAGRWLRSDAPPTDEPAPASRPAVALPPAVPPAPASVAPAPRPDSPLLPLPTTPLQDAAASMSSAREQGDPRAPRIVRDVAPPAATPAELADPEAYQRYEARQNQRLYNAYVKAADSEIPQLQQDIERARHEGIPPEEIAKAEEKVRRIQNMRDQLQATHPDTAADAGAEKP